MSFEATKLNTPLKAEIFVYVIFLSHTTLIDVLCRYKAAGIRLDSGDLAYLSCQARKFFNTIEEEFKVPGFGKSGITASNDLNEETLDALNKQVTIIFVFSITKNAI